MAPGGPSGNGGSLPTPIRSSSPRPGSGGQVPKRPCWEMPRARTYWNDSFALIYSLRPLATVNSSRTKNAARMKCAAPQSATTADAAIAYRNESLPRP